MAFCKKVATKIFYFQMIWVYLKKKSIEITENLIRKQKNVETFLQDARYTTPYYYFREIVCEYEIEV